MKIISHRANLYGPDPKRENEPSSVLNTLQKGFGCEIDVWCIDGSWFLGHDEPVYSIDFAFLAIPELYIHCKNIEAAKELSNTNHKTNLNLHYFWHQNDDITLTSWQYLWTFPGKPSTHRSIVVAKDISDFDFLDKTLYGVCTDYPFHLEEKLS